MGLRWLSEANESIIGFGNECRWTLMSDTECRIVADNEALISEGRNGVPDANACINT